MLTYEQAIELILKKVTCLPPVDLPILETQGLVLAAAVQTSQPMPPFSNSSMDGFAVRAADLQMDDPNAAILLPVAGTLLAGEPPGTLEPGTTSRIMTGACLPEGADAVVPMEDVVVSGNHAGFKAPVAAGSCVRLVGSDAELGEIVVEADVLIRAAEIGMFAATGRDTVSVYPRPRVAILSTGDELVEPGHALQPGQIYNSNTYALSAQVKEAGGDVIVRRIAGDKMEDLRTAINDCGGADIIITSGGVSVGERDLVREVFAEKGSLDFWQVAIRPGKPIAFGSWDKILLFGLPGNPVSSMVTFELFVRPAIRKMRGLTALVRPSVQAELTEAVSHSPGRRSYVRVMLTNLDGRYIARPTGSQGSGNIRSMVMANGLLILPHFVESIDSGSMGTVMLLDSDLDN